METPERLSVRITGANSIEIVVAGDGYRLPHGVEYVRKNLIIPPEGPDREALVERLAWAMVDQLFIGTSQANACARAALKALAGEK